MPAITKVSVLSTGHVAIRPRHVRGTGSPMLWWLLTSRRWTAPRPINVYVIEHRDGLVLFDTGQDRRSVTDPHYFPGGIVGFFYRRLARFEVGPGDTLTAQLAALGYQASEVTTAVLSHLHQDHIGGITDEIFRTLLFGFRCGGLQGRRNPCGNFRRGLLFLRFVALLAHVLDLHFPQGNVSQ